MALNAKKIKDKNGFSEQKLLDIDNYPARVVQVIDLGLQDGGEWNGEKKGPVNKIQVTYELVDAFMLDKDGNEMEDKPRWISEDLNIYGPQSDKAKCNQRYKAIDPDEVFEYNWAELINSPCMVMTAHKEVRGKTYCNVGTVTPYIVSKRNPELPELKNKPKVFDLSEPDMEVFDGFPDWMKDKIKGNLEFKGSPLEAALGGEQPKPAKEEKPVPEKDEEDNAGDKDRPW